MKKLMLAAALIYGAMVLPAAAVTPGKHDLGDLYTRALNKVESAGMLDSLAPNRHMPITDIHADQGQVLISVTTDSGSRTIIYDLVSGKILSSDTVL